jgi:probable phosphoglycerate mutase
MTLAKPEPEPTRLLLIRHGETDWNRAQRIQGQIDIALNETGVAQAQRLGQALAGEPIAAIYASDLDRAQVTAQAVSRVSGVALRTDLRLRERHYGAFQGLTYDEIVEQWPQQAQSWRERDPSFAPEGGESLLDLYARVLPALESLASAHSGEQIVWVTHGGVIDVLYRIATRQDLKIHRTWELGNTAINRLLWTPQGLTLVAWGDMAHLSEAARDETV